MGEGERVRYMVTGDLALGGEHLMQIYDDVLSNYILETYFSNQCCPVNLIKQKNLELMFEV